MRKYAPSMVIIMAGLNDVKKAESGFFFNIKMWLERFKTYKLAEQFWPEIFNPDPIDYAKTERAYENPATVENFNRIREILDSRGISLVVVQYATRSLEPLRNVFRSKDGIVFVNNQEIFTKALANGKYKDYFVDRFAGDFGHCNQNGNRMIAENMADTVLQNGGF